MKSKRLTSVMISICFILGLFPAISFAQSWDGTSKTEPTKNADGAYAITSAEELAWFAGNAGGNNAILTDDIDLANKEWSPIAASASAKYTGTFDGNGHTISRLKISANAQYLGLFGYIGSGGTVKNLSVSGEVVYTGTSTDSYTGGLSAYSEGAVENCLSDVDVTGKGRIGGITGQIGITDAKIASCANCGTITNTSTSGSYYTGGIVGYINVSTTLKDIYNTGDVTAGKYAGGIAGYVGNLNSITNAYSTGAINCSDTTYRGGIAVTLSFSVSTMAKKITNCYFLQNSTVNKDLLAFTKTTRDDLCGKTENEMKSAEFSALLGTEFTKDAKNINSGYPILKWQEIPERAIKIDGELLTSDTPVISAGQHHIEIDYSSVGANIEDGLLTLAAYGRNGALEKIWLADEAYAISVDYNAPAGAVIKVLFWKNALQPVTSPLEIKIY